MLNCHYQGCYGTEVGTERCDQRTAFPLRGVWGEGGVLG